MVSENLKEWIKSKREEGISDERIRKSLERTDHDPSVLDELDDPFDSEASEKKTFDSEASENQSSEEKEEDSDVLEDDFSFTDEEDQDDEPTKQVQPEEDNTKETKSRLKELETNVQASITTTRDNFSRKKAGLGIFIILLVAGGIAAYSFAPDSLEFPESESELSLIAEDLDQLDTRYAGCPDSGVRIETVSSTETSTSADVLVTRNEAEVVLEVFRDGELVGFTRDTVLGEAQITVDEVGDEVKLRPLGCEERSSTRSY